MGVAEKIKTRATIAELSVKIHFHIVNANPKIPGLRALHFNWTFEEGTQSNGKEAWMPLYMNLKNIHQAVSKTWPIVEYLLSYLLICIKKKYFWSQ